MEELSNLRGRARVIFQIAAQRRGVTLSDRSIEELADRASLIGDPSRTRFQDIFSHGSFRPTNRFAVLLAEQLRRFLGVSDVEPLISLPFLLSETLGITTFEVEPREISGGCAIVAGLPMIFMARVDDIQGLFTCAHQLAHLILLSNQSEAASLDLVGEPLGTAKNPYEHFADNVALRLLIPERGLGIALRETRKLLRATGPLGDVELLYVARIFGVSLLAIGKRCEEAKLLPKGGATALDRFLIEKFGGAERRADELDLPARPVFSVVQAFEAPHEKKKTPSVRPVAGAQKLVNKDRY